MYTVWGTTRATETSADLSCGNPSGWPIRLGDMANTSVKFGDDVDGPIFGPVVCQPGTVGDHAPAHAHASDNFRIILRGTFKMGPETYGPGEFRFQQGWKPYPGEDIVGDDGIWMAVLMANRRGFRARYVNDAPPHEVEMHRYLAATYELKGDAWYSDDPDDTAGPSAIVTNIGGTRSGKINGSFNESHSWPASHPGTRALVSLLGEPACGPVVLLTSTEPGGVVTPRCRFGTEVFRMIVNGSCEIDGRPYVTGDMRVDRAGAWSERIVAGPEGLQQVFIIGDRRFANPALESARDDFAFGTVIRDLTDQLGRSI
jgi:hypothetical protein